MTDRATPDALDLLRRADPLASVHAAELERRARELRPHDSALASSGDSPRRLSRRRAAIVAIALVAAAVVAVPALGIDLPALDFGEAEKAPPKVVRSFASLAEGAPPGMDPGVIAGETRRVTTVRALGKDHILWVAPTRAGGFCDTWSGLGGGCDRLGTVPLGVTWGSGPVPVPRGEPAVTRYVYGHANGRYVRTVEARFDDGETVRLPLVWVSEPINAGFFLYALPREHGEVGRELEAVDALDEDGNLVTRQALSWSPDVDRVPVDAVVDERRAVIRSANEGGEAVLWQAPTRYDGLCTWLEYAARTRDLGCRPRGYGGEGTAMGFFTTATDVLVWVDVSIRTVRVELSFADGTRRTLHEQGGFVMAALPRRNLAADRFLTGATMLKRDGDIVVTFPVDFGTVCRQQPECPLD